MKRKTKITNKNILTNVVKVVVNDRKKRKGKVKTYRVHRLVAEAFIEKVEGCDYVDHIDGNALNKNVNNLRWVNIQQNSLNSKIYKNNTSGFKGVAYRTRDKLWVARWSVDKKEYKRYFKTQEEALEHRREMVEKYYSKEHYIEDR